MKRSFFTFMLFETFRFVVDNVYVLVIHPCFGVVKLCNPCSAHAINLFQEETFTTWPI